MRSLSRSNRKGQLNNLVPAIMALVLAAVILVFGVILTQGLVDTTPGNVGVTVENETFSPVNNVTNTTSGNVNQCGFGGFAVVAASNYTGGVILAGNYTTFAANGNIIGTSDMTIGYNNSEWLVNYTYAWGDEACTAGNLTIFGLGSFANFWEIIVLAIVIGVVIGLLLVIFGGKRGR